STAGLKARRFTSLRSGRNSLSPASVTPPQMTTTSGLKMLTTFATPAPRNFAVSCTTSSAYPSPSCAASYTICAVILARSPVAQRKVDPAEVGGEQHDARRRVERPGRSDPEPRDLLAARRGHRSARQLHDAAQHALGALLRERGLGDEAEHLGAVLGYGAGDDVRPADVNPDDVAHPSPRWRGARPRP